MEYYFDSEKYKELSPKGIKVIIEVLEKIREKADFVNWKKTKNYQLDEDNPFSVEVSTAIIPKRVFSNYNSNDILDIFGSDFPFVDYEKSNDYNYVFFLPLDFFNRYKAYKKMLLSLLNNAKESQNDSPLKNKNDNHPSFNETPPQIIFGNTKVSIPSNSIQFCACKIMFDKKIGETVSWDEIAEEIDGFDENGILKTSWRTVYDSIRAINNKIKEKTGKKIFKTSRKSFSRIE